MNISLTTEAVFFLLGLLVGVLIVAFVNMILNINHQRKKMMKSLCKKCKEKYIAYRKSI